MQKVIRWGIIGPGAIAHKFVQDLMLLENTEITAVASRSSERAESFGEQYSIPKRYGSYQELASDPEVDVVYIATLHTEHEVCSRMCIEAGKAVLCEKPFTVNAQETDALIKSASHHGVFLMEAMWMRFLPAIIKVREWVQQGVIGDIRMVKADFGFRGAWDPNSRYLNPKIGGGALLDVGVYTLSFATLILGVNPVNIVSNAYIGSTGVDEQNVMLLGYENGRMAMLTSAVRTNLANEACIYGTEGHIRIPTFWQAKSVNLFIDGKEEERLDFGFDGIGYRFEAEEVMNCIRQGKIQSDVMPLNESLKIMKIMDTVRSQWGLKYPCD